MKKVGFIVLIIMSLSSFYYKDGDIIRMNNPTINTGIKTITPFISEINDTIPNDTLFVYYDAGNIPVKYSRKVITGVCIKGECRLVNIELFWNITGSYLGFELPEGEFLSKTEHVKFNENEYDRLHLLLSDSHSALANYSLNELVPGKDSTLRKVDAVSSATIAAVLDYIVEGAVYTTYTLWHIVYGPTQKAIENLTNENLTNDVLIKILNSEKITDKVWGLNHISNKREITKQLKNKLMELIAGNDIYLAERALNALNPDKINRQIQLELVNTFQQTGFLQKRLIIQKLKQVKHLDKQVALNLAEEIESLNGVLIKSTLELFRLHKIEDELLNIQICKLLKNKNRYISNQAFKYLESIDSKNNKVLKNIEKYKKRHL